MTMRTVSQPRGGQQTQTQRTIGGSPVSDRPKQLPRQDKSAGSTNARRNASSRADSGRLPWTCGPPLRQGSTCVCWASRGPHAPVRHWEQFGHAGRTRGMHACTRNVQRTRGCANGWWDNTRRSRSRVGPTRPSSVGHYSRLPAQIDRFRPSPADLNRLGPIWIGSLGFRRLRPYLNEARFVSASFHQISAMLTYIILCGVGRCFPEFDQL